SEHPGVRSAMGSLFEPGFGGTAQQWGPNWGLFRPYHLACVEVPMSMARAIFSQKPTGDLRGGMVAELVAAAKKDLTPGDELDGGGGYTVYGLSEKSEVARRENLVPFGFAYHGRVRLTARLENACSAATRLPGRCAAIKASDALLEEGAFSGRVGIPRSITAKRVRFVGSSWMPSAMILSP